MQMNFEKLKLAEANFLSEYPGGFEHPEMLKIGKKHKMDKMIELAKGSFAASNFTQDSLVCENMVKLVNRSSMVSMFEKPKFRDFVNGMNDEKRAFFVDALKEMLHGKKQLGFEAFVELLKTEKLAKWSLVTILPTYLSPKKEVFVKPTTAKGVIEFFEVEELVYKPQPTWQFYIGYRKLINQMKKQVSKELSPSNAAFSGFLMMAMKM